MSGLQLSVRTYMVCDLLYIDVLVTLLSTSAGYLQGSSVGLILIVRGRGRRRLCYFPYIVSASV